MDEPHGYLRGGKQETLSLSAPLGFFWVKRAQNKNPGVSERGKGVQDGERTGG